MSKRIKVEFNDSLKFKKMYDAYKRASQGKKKNKDVIIFSIDLATNLVNILKSLKARYI